MNKTTNVLFFDSIRANLQLGSGKTHTMEGTAEDPGVIRRVCEDLFIKIAERSDR